MRHVGVFLVLLWAITVGSAAAQTAGEGLFNAVSFKDIPMGVSVAVRPLDNSDDNLILQEDFERELRARGYLVNSDAPFVLSFETRDVVGAWSDRSNRHVLELYARGGRGGGEDLRARVNVFDSQQGGLINQGQGGGTAIVTPTQFRVDATIEDRGTGERLWQAWAVANLERSDGLTLKRSMILL